MCYKKRNIFYNSISISRLIEELKIHKQGEEYTVIKMLVAILLMSLVSLALGQSCPDPKDEKLKLTPHSENLEAEYKARASRTRMDMSAKSDYVNDMMKSDPCPEPTYPDDDPSNDPEFIRKEAASQAAEFITVVKRTCEPCPVRNHFLSRFYGSCYVIAPQQQQVRYVTCQSKRCNAPCMCANSYCQRKQWVKTWFFAWCFGANLPGGFQPGLNYRYLNLPQDCSCVEPLIKPIRG